MKKVSPKKTAAGLPAVAKTLEKALGDMGALRTFKTLRQVNQKDGFDCPGCAWPEPEEDRAALEFCENGAKAVADEATTRRAGPGFFAKWSIAALAAQSDQWLNAQGRLTHPLILREGADHYEPLSWQDAFGVVAAELKGLTSPDEAVFYTSGRTSNEAAFLYQLFVRMYGTNNLPDCSNMCHESSGEGMRDTLGVGKGTVTLEDFAQADAIFLIGQNPGTNHPRMLSTLQAAARRGCEIVSINPLPEAGLLAFRHPQEVAGLLGFETPLSSLFVPVRINGDVALLQGIMKEMIEEDGRTSGKVLDHSFFREYTCGFEEFAQNIRSRTWDEIVASSGVGRELIRKAAEVAMRSERTICCWAMGITQHRNAVANVQEIVNFLLLRGNVGRPGAGACPVRGHSNVQGDRTMGIWERMPDSFLSRLGDEFRFSPPRLQGHDTVAAIRAMSTGDAKVFVALGGNFLMASPDTDLTAEALRRCRLTVHISTKPNRAHLAGGRLSLILPCLGRTEHDMQASGPQFVTTENSMGVISRSEGVLAPASETLKSEVAIVAGMAEATLGVDWSAYAANYGAIRDRIERVIPGFTHYDSRIKRDATFTLPNAARERTFLTKTGKANFTIHPLPVHGMSPGELLLMTIRSHDQFNTTVYTDNDRYRGIYGNRRVVFLNEADLPELGVAGGDLVDLVSNYDGVERIAPKFTAAIYPIPRNCAATYFPEGNVLVPLDHVATGSNTPASKSVVIRLRRSPETPHG